KKRWKDSVRMLRRAIALQESVVAANPDSADDAYDLTNMLDLFGNALRTGNRLDEAEAAWKRAVAISERILTKQPNHASHLCSQHCALKQNAELLLQKDPSQVEAILGRAQALAVRFQAAERKTGFLFDRSALALAGIDRALGALYREKGRT